MAPNAKINRRNPSVEDRIEKWFKEHPEVGYYLAVCSITVIIMALMAVVILGYGNP